MAAGDNTPAPAAPAREAQQPTLVETPGGPRRGPAPAPDAAPAAPADTTPTTSQGRNPERDGWFRHYIASSGVPVPDKLNMAPFHWFYLKYLMMDAAIFCPMLVAAILLMTYFLQTSKDTDGILRKPNAVVSGIQAAFCVCVFVSLAVYQFVPSLTSLACVFWSTMFAIFFGAISLALALHGIVNAQEESNSFFHGVLGTLGVCQAVACFYHCYRTWDLNDMHYRRFGVKLHFRRRRHWYGHHPCHRMFGPRGASSILSRESSRRSRRRSRRRHSSVISSRFSSPWSS